MSRKPLLAVVAASLIPGAIVITPAAAVEPTAAEQAFLREVQPFFEAHCVRCHNDQRQRGNFRIDTLSHDVGGGPSVHQWVEVMEKISSGEMPPPEEDVLPTADEADDVVAWLAARVKEGEAARLAQREPVSLLRLSREEYGNTVADLLGVNINVADPGGLSEDPEWHGFERIGSVMSLSASHIEKYFAIAEAILDEAYPESPPEPVVSRKRALDLRGGPNQHEIAALEEQGLADKVRVDLWPGHQLQGGRPGPAHNMTRTAGDYRVRIQVSGLRPPGGRAPRLTFYVDRIDRMLFEQDIIASEDEPVVVEFTAHLPPGNHSYRVSNDVPGPSILPRSGRAGREPFFSLAEGRIPWQLKLTDEEGVPLYPFLIIDWIEWEGPMITDEQRRLRSRFLPAGETLEAARESLAHFARKAFRRDVGEQEIDRYLDLVEAELAAGEEFLPAYKTAMLAILCSVDFLHLVEGSPERDLGGINDWELASRLSYFLWSTMPDETLFELARTGTLHEPDVLREQVGRMLADPRAASFSETFPRQWLQMQKLGMFPPDSMLYPDYDDHLESSMAGETLEFFRHVLENNLGLQEFIVSDWTMINPRLAMHYGLVPPEHDRFERVKLAPEDNRSGILTHASVLSLTSDGTRHRPVHRGVWVMEAIFGRSPPPPPANVDPIEPNPVDEPKATIRMKLAAHTRDPTCASCHRRIDPLGFAFDHYDAIGRWRDEEVVPDGQGDNPPVDASGTLMDGRTFEDAAGFQQLLLDDLDQFNSAFVGKLATFALRRAMTVDDRDDLAALAEQTRAADYRLRDTIEALVLSDLFRKR